MHICTQYTLFVWTVILALKCFTHSPESVVQQRLKKKKILNLNLLRITDCTAHEHAIRIASKGLCVKCVCACTVLMSEIRWRD